jgi:hypothetical protein
MVAKGPEASTDLQMPTLGELLAITIPEAVSARHVCERVHQLNRAARREDKPRAHIDWGVLANLGARSSET